MKLMFIIVRDMDAENTIQALVAKGYRLTRVASTGGFLHRGNVTLMAGVDDHQVKSVIDLLKETCEPAEESQHRATIFVVDMPVFEQV